MLLRGVEPNLACWKNLAQAYARSWRQALLLVEEKPELLESVVDALQVLESPCGRPFRGCFGWSWCF